MGHSVSRCFFIFVDSLLFIHMESRSYLYAETSVSHNERLLLLHREGHGVHAIALPGRFWAVLEDVAKVRAAAPTHHFNPFHAEAVVYLGRYTIGRDRVPETWPPATRIELRRRAKQICPATHTLVDAFWILKVILPCERALGRFLTTDRILRWRELLTPFFIGFGDFVRHFLIPLTLALSHPGEGILTRQCRCRQWHWHFL